MIRRIILICIFSALLAACGTSTQERSTSKLTAEEVVAQRAQARWDAIIAKDYATAHGYLTPGTQATTPVNAYVLRMSAAMLRWTGATVRKVTCEEPDVCRVVVSIAFSIRQTRLGMSDLKSETPLTENWLRSDGQWYHLPETMGR